MTPPATIAPEASPRPVLDQHRSILDRPVRFFFVTGARRSGTTLLTAMLNTHPEAYCCNEGWLVNGLGSGAEHWIDPEKFGAWASLGGAEHGWLRNIPASDARMIAARGAVEALMREAAARAPWKNPARVRVIGDKSVEHYCHGAETLWRLFPEAKYIHMLRDGRDVVVSEMFLRFRHDDFEAFGAGADQARRAKGVWFEGSGGRTAGDIEGGDTGGRAASATGPATDVEPLFNEDSLGVLAESWASAVRAGRQASGLFGDRYFEVRYEDLLEGPSPLAAVLGFLGVGAADEQVSACAGEARFERHSGGRKPGEEDPRSDLRSGVAGDWRRFFTPRDLEVFREAAGGVLDELGYGADE